VIVRLEERTEKGVASVKMHYVTRPQILPFVADANGAFSTENLRALQGLVKHVKNFQKLFVLVDCFCRFV
jgi:hypothetical protein